MGYQKLITSEVVKLYKQLFNLRGKCSCGDVAQELDIRGVRTHTGKAPTRQAIFYQMRHVAPADYELDLGVYTTPVSEGKMLLDVTNVYNRGHEPSHYPREWVDVYIEQEGLDASD